MFFCGQSPAVGDYYEPPAVCAAVPPVTRPSSTLLAIALLGQSNDVVSDEEFGEALAPGTDAFDGSGDVAGLPLLRGASSDTSSRIIGGFSFDESKMIGSSSDIVSRTIGSSADLG